jgi:uncharacterized Zn finger protein (UPF0148 family)
MSLVNVTCERCGTDNLFKPEIKYDENAICPTCHRKLYRDHEAEVFYTKHPEITERVRAYFKEYNKRRPPGVDPVII